MTSYEITNCRVQRRNARSQRRCFSLDALRTAVEKAGFINLRRAVGFNGSMVWWAGLPGFRPGEEALVAVEREM